MKKMLKILSFTSLIPVSSFFVISCSNNEISNHNKKTMEKYDENIIFTNKLSNLTPKKQLSKVVENTNNDYIPIFPIVKQFSGDILIKDKLPSELKFVNSQNQFKFYPVSWSVDNDMQIFSNTTINGIVNYEGHDFPVKTYVITQLKSNINESDYFSKEEGWTIDLEKSTRDGNSSNLPKLIDRSGNYRSSASRWDNWGKFGEEQDTNLVFHWEEPTNISRFEVNFWLYASQGNSSGKLPKRIFVQYSKDGENWINVENQDKITDEDLGPMRGMSGSLVNTAHAKVISFKTVKTNWIRIHWEPAQDNQGKNHILGITNIAFKGIDKQDILNFSQSNDIFGYEYNGVKYKNNSEIININSQDFDDNFKIFTNATTTVKHVVSEKQKQKTYKVISYNDLGEYKVYTIIVDKNKA
ncbi:hypothetical protein RRG46_02240 [Mycoplasmopsis cynos]|uniref:F5/8 type C domain-containing protein n=1 Tax=Mycoplasmopsis cynos TaxID=171284 RepID=A0ABD8AJ04_9BACT|nr:hypothetical protein [Mycoplasmopsis cynos]WQQ19647.1 hypothetical protein RRG46_02240 [Mycoplasmopsis cynos]